MEFEVFDSLTSSPAPAQADATSPLVRLQYLIDNTPAIIYATVPSGDFKMTFVSNNAYNVLGYRPEEMVADPNFWFDHIHPDDAPSIFSSLAQLFVDGEKTYEYRFRTAGGEFLWMYDRLRLIYDDRGTPVEVIGSLTDITARKLMEQKQQLLIARLSEAHDQLLQSEKMASIGQLAAGVAHEINNPIGFVNSNMGTLRHYVGTLLSVVDAYSDAVKKEAPGSPLAAQIEAIGRKADLGYLKEDIADLVSESMDGLKRVKDIVQALKDFSHVGQMDWQYADVHSGIDTTLNIVANEIKYKATVEKHYGKLPEIKCLASQLNQVFMNLLVNAAQAIQSKGVITIATGASEGWVWIRISDNGSGIAPENLKRVFEPFFTTKPVGSGTGLGLSLSYSIVNKHGGRIDVASKPGVGTVFTIRLPVVPPGSASGGDAAGD
ncbi:PAS domain-containing protein [Massilia sp. TW-1]|uniref:histidine kinase n=1 Tax=Telluria antibiotica TaxID=2717319 RepID=A0ABX0P4S1_9BURK|nr:ATP-binding protein [Telluria antibiotica]NIA52221.1 PAS domain-containing protein [Telluria antibiotica]